MNMTWGDFGKGILSAAPLIGSIIGGPIGGITAAVGGILGEAFGVEASPEALNRAISSNPDAYVKLKEIEQKERKQLLEWQTMQVQAELANIVSARNREVELAKAGHKSAWATSIVSIIVTIGFFTMLYFLVQYGEETIGSAGLFLLGTLGAAFGAVVNYYLGSSLGSNEKNNLLLKHNNGG